jgi:hypothetical protein
MEERLYDSPKTSTVPNVVQIRISTDSARPDPHWKCGSRCKISKNSVIKTLNPNPHGPKKMLDPDPALKSMLIQKNYLKLTIMTLSCAVITFKLLPRQS